MQMLESNNPRPTGDLPKNLNHPAVWLTIVLTQVIIFLWFEVFFTQARSTLAPTVERAPEMEGNILPLYIIGFMVTMVAMYVLAAVFNRFQLNSARDGAIAGLILGVVVNVFSMITIFNFSEHPVEIAVLDFGLNALIFFMVGLVHGIWPGTPPDTNT